MDSDERVCSDCPCFFFFMDVMINSNSLVQKTKQKNRNLLLEKCGKVLYDAVTADPAPGSRLCRLALGILVLHSCSPSPVFLWLITFPEFSQTALALFTCQSSG